MIDIASAIQLLITVANVLRDIWEGPLGQMIRDLVEGKELSAQSVGDLDDVLKNKITVCKETQISTIVAMLKGIYFLTIAKYTNPSKYAAAKRIKRLIKEIRD
jgi:hypothetical protein